MQYGNIEERKREGTVNVWSANEDDVNLGRIDDNDESLQDVPKKRVRIRVPVVRSRSARQHKLTIVRRRPLSSHTKDFMLVIPTEHAPRRIVVTRVRTLESDKSIYPTDTLNSVDYQSTGKHKVTITRRRKLQSTPILSKSVKDKVRVTRKKLVAVRPILPTPTVAIITTGFFTAPSSEYDDEYSDEEDETEYTTVKEEDHIVITPSLEETPNLIDNKPDEETNLASLEASLTESKESTSDTPIIITDNFFFPPSDDEQDEEYDDDYFDVTTTTENVDNILKDEHSTTEVISVKDENNVMSNESDIETKQDNITIPINQITSEKSPQEQSVKMIQESDNASIDTTEFIDTSLENGNITANTSTIVLNEDVPTTEFVPIEKDDDDNSATKEYTTTANPEEQTTFIDDVTVLNLPETTESTTLSDDEDTTNIPNTTEVHDLSVTEMIMLDAKEENQESSEDTGRDIMPETVSEIPEELLRVRPIQPDVKTDSNSTQSSLVETVFSSKATFASSFESVIPLATTKLPTNYSSDSYVPSVIPLSASYDSETKSSIRKTLVLDTIPVTKVTTKIASPTPEEIEAGLTDDLYLSLSRLDFPEILPSKPATIGLETKSTPDLTLEPSTSVYYTETVVTSTRLRTYTYVVTQQNGLETKVTSSTTVRPRVTTLTLTVPVTVTVTPTVESSANFVSSVYNPVPIAGE